jgi:hypothetical protein
MILKTESVDTMSMLMDDFIERYRSVSSVITNKQECWAFLKDIVP